MIYWGVNDFRYTRICLYTQKNFFFNIQENISIHTFIFNTQLCFMHSYGILSFFVFGKLYWRGKFGAKPQQR